MTVEAWEAPPAAPTRASIVFRTALIVLALLASLAVLALSGAKGSQGQLVDDVRSGRTRHVLVREDRVVWRDGSFLNRVIRLDGRYGSTSSSPELHRPEDVRRFLAERADASADTVRDLPGWAEPRTWLRWVSLLAFLTLLFGPRPWTFNRWGWFWFFWFWRPVGALAFLLLGGPSVLRRSPPARGARSGGDGCLAVFLLTLLLGALSIGLQALLRRLGTDLWVEVG